MFLVEKSISSSSPFKSTTKKSSSSHLSKSYQLAAISLDQKISHHLKTIPATSSSSSSTSLTYLSSLILFLTSLHIECESQISNVNETDVDEIDEEYSSDDEKYGIPEDDVVPAVLLCLGMTLSSSQVMKSLKCQRRKIAAVTAVYIVGILADVDKFSIVYRCPYLGAAATTGLCGRMTESENRLPQQPSQAHTDHGLTQVVVGWIWGSINKYTFLRTRVVLKRVLVECLVNRHLQGQYCSLVNVLTLCGESEKCLKSAHLSLNASVSAISSSPPFLVCDAVLSLFAYDHFECVTKVNRENANGLKVSSVFVLMEDLSLPRDALFLRIDSSTQMIFARFHQDKGLVFQSYMSMNRMYPLCEEIKELPEQSTESFNDHVCKDSLVGKQTRKNITKSSSWRANDVLELVHSDICSPIFPPSNTRKRSPTKALTHTTPEEAWSGEKPTVNHFRMWGSVAHVHIPKEKRKKPDEKSFICILTGVSEESKAYCLINPLNMKVVVRDYTPIDGDTFEVFDDEEELQQPPADNDNVEEQPNEAVIQDAGPSNTTAREGRVRRPPRFLDDYATREEVILSDKEQLNVMEVIDQDPIRYDEAIKHEKWVKAMDQEIQSIEKNETWQLVDLPEDVKCIEVK
ncbi:retrovirus-related pol polyprotein from transposon TNT 1-94 [Tanacetum coccineum]